MRCVTIELPQTQNLKHGTLIHGAGDFDLRRRGPRLVAPISGHMRFVQKIVKDSFSCTFIWVFEGSWLVAPRSVWCIYRPLRQKSAIPHHITIENMRFIKKNVKDPFCCTSIKVFQEHGFMNASKPFCGESYNITFVWDEGIFFFQGIILCFLALKQHFFFSKRQCFIQWTNESRLSQDWEMVWTISNLVCFTLSDKAETFIGGRELRSLVE